MLGRLFCYGTLQVPEIIETVLGRVPKNESVTLTGYTCYTVKERPYPALLPEPGASTDGVLYEGVTREDILRLDDYEGPEYLRRKVTPENAIGRSVTAWGYVWKPQLRGRLSDQPWDLHQFKRRSLPGYLARLRAGHPE